MGLSIVRKELEMMRKGYREYQAKGRTNENPEGVNGREVVKNRVLIAEVLQHVTALSLFRIVAKNLRCATQKDPLVHV